MKNILRLRIYHTYLNLKKNFFLKDVLWQEENWIQRKGIGIQEITVKYRNRYNILVRVILFTKKKNKKMKGQERKDKEVNKKGGEQKKWSKVRKKIRK